MARFSEAAKGIGAFVIGTIIFYVAYQLVQALLTIATGVDPYLGGFAWISIIIAYVTTCIIYPVYAVLINSDETKSTDITCVAKAAGFWIAGTVFCILVFTIIGYLTPALQPISIQVEDLSGNFQTVNTDTEVTITHTMAWLIVLSVYVVFTIVFPVNYITKAFAGKEAPA